MQNRQTPIDCSIIRGGTSRGVYFLASSLPSDETLRDAVLFSIIGGPDALQVDGIGGGHPLTNKVAVVGASTRDDADVDYLFLQVSVDTQRVSAAQNCGNILAGVGPFAIERGLVTAQDPVTNIRVHMVNSGNLCELTVPTPDQIVKYTGDTMIDGVPNAGAPIICSFLDVAGSATGALLPTGTVLDEVNGVEVTCIDNGMPVVLLRASDFGLHGDESPEALDADDALKTKLESIRLQLGPKMNLGNVKEKTVPKMCLVSASDAGGHVRTRTFIPHACHRAIGVLGAVSVATATLLRGSVTDGMAIVPPGNEKTLVIQHPGGEFAVRLLVDENEVPEKMVRKAGVVRTARTLMRGEVYVPASVWDAGNNSAGDASDVST